MKPCSNIIAGKNALLSILHGHAPRERGMRIIHDRTSSKIRFRVLNRARNRPALAIKSRLRARINPGRTT